MTVREGKQAGAAGSMAPTSASPSVSLPLTFTSPPPSLVLDLSSARNGGGSATRAHPAQSIWARWDFKAGPLHDQWTPGNPAHPDSRIEPPGRFPAPAAATAELLLSVLPILIVLSHHHISLVRACSIATNISSIYTTSSVYTTATMSKQFDAAEIKEHKSGE